MMMKARYGLKSVPTGLVYVLAALNAAINNAERLMM